LTITEPGYYHREVLLRREGMMKKRQRKKLHLGEFTEYGVEVVIKVLSEMPPEAFERLIDEGLVGEFAEGNGLCCGGGWDSSKKSAHFFFETGRDRKRAEEISGKLREWLEGKGLRYELETKVDNAWYPV
jgi:uncharacterized protein YggL (DUF469 family)